MAINKAHDEFRALDMSSGGDTPAGCPEGIQQKVLSGALDETNNRGSRTRILCFAPGVYTAAPFVHEYREEMFLFSSDLMVGNDDKGQRRRIFQAEYLCMPVARRVSWPAQVGSRPPVDGDPLF